MARELRQPMLGTWARDQNAERRLPLPNKPRLRRRSATHVRTPAAGAWRTFEIVRVRIAVATRVKPQATRRSTMHRSYLRRVFASPRTRAAVALAAVVSTGAALAAIAAPAAAAEAVKQGLRLAFFCSGGSNDYQLTGIKAAQETAAKYSASLQWFDAQFDTAKQLNQIMAATSSGNFDGFVIEAVNASTVCSSVKAALAKKIVVAMTNVQACDTPYEVPYPGTVIMTGGQAASVYEAWFRKGFDSDPEGGEFAVLVGPITQGNSVRARSVLDKLKSKYPNWKLVGFEDTGYNAGP